MRTLRRKVRVATTRTPRQDSVRSRPQYRGISHNKQNTQLSRLMCRISSAQHRHVCTTWQSVQFWRSTKHLFCLSETALSWRPRHPSTLGCSPRSRKLSQTFVSNSGMPADKRMGCRTFFARVFFFCIHVAVHMTLRTVVRPPTRTKTD